MQRAVTLDELEDVEGNVAIGHTGMHGQQPLEDCKHELALLHIGDLQLEDAEEELTFSRKDINSSALFLSGNSTKLSPFKQ